MKFFDLGDYYKTNFKMINTGKWSLIELDQMTFWEREIYVNLVAENERKIKEKLSGNNIGIPYG